MAQDPPTLVYDGECGICRYWVTYWQDLTEDRVIYRSYQEAATDFPSIPVTQRDLADTLRLSLRRSADAHSDRPVVGTSPRGTVLSASQYSRFQARTRRAGTVAGMRGPKTRQGDGRVMIRGAA
jgi:hypothetical protein